MKGNHTMKAYKRIFTIVIDSLGIGEMADSADYGDTGANTFGHIWESQGGLQIPNLMKLGIGKLCGINSQQSMGYAMRLEEASTGKDTLTGHWELMGLHTTQPFRTFTDTGFPPELIQTLEEKIGRKIVGNKAASGTEIIDELGEHEIATGDLIVYTSADSVMQICGNEETMGLDNLYHYCEIARELTLKDEWKVGRVIARPYIGRKRGEFKRTANRRDYALKPSGKTVLDALKESGYQVISVGKINDIFCGEGITESHKSKSSIHGMEQTLEIMDKGFEGLCFVNLVDFDALWGHRRDPQGYAKELETFDELLGKMMNKLKNDDLAIITADHGNDPTYTGTDHTREGVPCLAYSPSMTNNQILATKRTFAVVGSTIADNFHVKMPPNTIGESVLQEWN